MSNVAFSQFTVCMVTARVHSRMRTRRHSERQKSTLARAFNQMGEPRFHVAPAAGWINDPNGPLHRQGMTHMYASVTVLSLGQVHYAVDVGGLANPMFSVM